MTVDVYAEAERRYYEDPVFHARVNLAADAALAADRPESRSERIKLRQRFRAPAAYALIIAEQALEATP